jgi:hypothetical protein
MIASAGSDNREQRPSVGALIKAPELAALLEVARRATLATAGKLRRVPQAIRLAKVVVAFYLLYM